MTRCNQSNATRLMAGDSESAQFLCSDVVTGIQLVKDNSIQDWNAMAGPVDAMQAKMQAPSTIRAAYGTDKIRNAVHASSSAQA